VDTELEEPREVVDIASFREALLAMGRGAAKDAFRDFSPEMVLHIPAAFPWDPGERRGPNAMIAFLAYLVKSTKGQFRNRLVDVMAGEKVATALNRVTATRNGRTKSWDTVWTYRFEHGMVVEAWLLPSLSEEEVLDFWG